MDLKTKIEYWIELSDYLTKDKLKEILSNSKALQIWIKSLIIY